MRSRSADKNRMDLILPAGGRASSACILLDGNFVRANKVPQAKGLGCLL